jgi:hypothetical protein
MKIAKLLKTFFENAKNIWVIRIYLGALFIGVIIYFYKHEESLAMLSKISHFQILPLIFVLNLLFFLCYVYVNYSTYRALNTNISYWQTFQVVAFSRLGVYVPGKVWYAANYYMFSRSLHIEAQLPLVARYFLIILPVLMIVLIHPKVLDKIFSVLIGKLSQLSSESKAAGSVDMERMSWSSESKAAGSVDMERMSWSYLLYLKFIGLYFFLWFANGIALYLCIRVFEVVDIHTFPVIIAAGASGLIIGLLAVFAPGGVGIREGITVAMLSQIVPVETAVLSCILLRLTQVILDLAVGGTAAALFIKKQKRSFEIMEADDVKS